MSNQRHRNKGTFKIYVRKYCDPGPFLDREKVKELPSEFYYGSTKLTVSEACKAIQKCSKSGNAVQRSLSRLKFIDRIAKGHIAIIDLKTELQSCNNFLGVREPKRDCCKKCKGNRPDSIKSTSPLDSQQPSTSGLQEKQTESRANYTKSKENPAFFPSTSLQAKPPKNSKASIHNAKRKLSEVESEEDSQLREKRLKSTPIAIECKELRVVIEKLPEEVVSRYLVKTAIPKKKEVFFNGQKVIVTYNDSKYLKTPEKVLFRDAPSFIESSPIKDPGHPFSFPFHDSPPPLMLDDVSFGQIVDDPLTALFEGDISGSNGVSELLLNDNEFAINAEQCEQELMANTPSPWDKELENETLQDKLPETSPTTSDIHNSPAVEKINEKSSGTKSLTATAVDSPTVSTTETTSSSSEHLSNSQSTTQRINNSTSTSRQKETIPGSTTILSPSNPLPGNVVTSSGQQNLNQTALQTASLSTPNSNSSTHIPGTPLPDSNLPKIPQNNTPNNCIQNETSKVKTSVYQSLSTMAQSPNGASTPVCGSSSIRLQCPNDSGTPQPLTLTQSQCLETIQLAHYLHQSRLANQRNGAQTRSNPIQSVNQTPQSLTRQYINSIPGDTRLTQSVQTNLMFGGNRAQAPPTADQRCESLRQDCTMGQNKPANQMPMINTQGAGVALDNNRNSAISNQRNNRHRGQAVNENDECPELSGIRQAAVRLHLNRSCNLNGIPGEVSVSQATTASDKSQNSGSAASSYQHPQQATVSYSASHPPSSNDPFQARQDKGKRLVSAGKPVNVVTPHKNQTQACPNKRSLMESNSKVTRCNVSPNMSASSSNVTFSSSSGEEPASSQMRLSSLEHVQSHAVSQYNAFSGVNDSLQPPQFTIALDDALANAEPMVSGPKTSHLNASHFTNTDKAHSIEQSSVANSIPLIGTQVAASRSFSAHTSLWPSSMSMVREKSKDLDSTAPMPSPVVNNGTKSSIINSQSERGNSMNSQSERLSNINSQSERGNSVNSQSERVSNINRQSDNKECQASSSNSETQRSRLLENDAPKSSRVQESEEMPTRNNSKKNQARKSALSVNIRDLQAKLQGFEKRVSSTQGESVNQDKSTITDNTSLVANALGLNLEEHNSRINKIIEAICLFFSHCVPSRKETLNKVLLSIVRKIKEKRAVCRDDSRLLMEAAGPVIGNTPAFRVLLDGLKYFISSSKAISATPSDVCTTVQSIESTSGTDSNTSGTSSISGATMQSIESTSGTESNTSGTSSISGATIQSFESTSGTESNVCSTSATPPDVCTTMQSVENTSGTKSNISGTSSDSCTIMPSVENTRSSTSGFSTSEDVTIPVNERCIVGRTSEFQDKPVSLSSKNSSLCATTRQNAPITESSVSNQVLTSSNNNPKSSHQLRETSKELNVSSNNLSQLKSRFHLRFIERINKDCSKKEQQVFNSLLKSLLQKLRSGQSINVFDLLNLKSKATSEFRKTEEFQELIFILKQDIHYVKNKPPTEVIDLETSEESDSAFSETGSSSSANNVSLSDLISTVQNKENNETIEQLDGTKDLPNHGSASYSAQNDQGHRVPHTSLTHSIKASGKDESLKTVDDSNNLSNQKPLSSSEMITSTASCTKTTTSTSELNTASFSRLVESSIESVANDNGPSNSTTQVNPSALVKSEQIASSSLTLSLSSALKETLANSSSLMEDIVTSSSAVNVQKATNTSTSVSSSVTGIASLESRIHNATLNKQATVTDTLAANSLSASHVTSASDRTSVTYSTPAAIRSISAIRGTPATHGTSASYSTSATSAVRSTPVTHGTSAFLDTPATIKTPATQGTLASYRTPATQGTSGVLGTPATIGSPATQGTLASYRTPATRGTSAVLGTPATIGSPATHDTLVSYRAPATRGTSAVRATSITHGASVTYSTSASQDHFPIHGISAIHSAPYFHNMSATRYTHNTSACRGTPAIHGISATHRTQTVQGPVTTLGMPGTHGVSTTLGISGTHCISATPLAATGIVRQTSRPAANQHNSRRDISFPENTPAVTALASLLQHDATLSNMQHMGQSVENSAIMSALNTSSSDAQNVIRPTIANNSGIPQTSIPEQPSYTPIKIYLPRPIVTVSTFPDGTVLMWDIPDRSQANFIDTYQIYAMQLGPHEQISNDVIKAKKWAPIGVIKSLPLPMAITLNNIGHGLKNFIVVCAVDRLGQRGPFSSLCMVRPNK